MKKFILVLLSVLLCLSLFSCEGDVVISSSSEVTSSEIASSVEDTSSEEDVFEFSENPNRCVDDNITRQIIEQAIYFHNPTEVESINKDDLVLYCERKLYSLGYINPDQNGDFMLSKETADKYMTAHFALDPFVWEIKYPFDFQTGEVLVKGYEEEKNAYNLGEYDNAYSSPWIECEVVDCVIKNTSVSVTLNVYECAISYGEEPDRMEHCGTFVYHGNLVNIWEGTTTFQLSSIEQTASAGTIIGVVYEAEQSAYDSDGNLKFTCTVKNNGILPLSFEANEVLQLKIKSCDFSFETPAMTLNHGEEYRAEVFVPADLLKSNETTYVEICPKAANGGEHIVYVLFERN